MRMRIGLVVSGGLDRSGHLHEERAPLAGLQRARLEVGGDGWFPRAHRIEALTNDGNIGEQKALERVGFRREGLMRGRSSLRGEYAGVLVYGLVREDRRPQTRPGPG